MQITMNAFCMYTILRTFHFKSFFYFIIRWLAIESEGNNIKSATVCFLVSHDLENIQQCKTFLMSFKASSMIKLQ